MENNSNATPETVEGLKDRLFFERNNHAVELRTMRGAYEQQLRELRAYHAENVGRLSEKHKAQIDQLKQSKAFACAMVSLISTVLGVFIGQAIIF